MKQGERKGKEKAIYSGHTHDIKINGQKVDTYLEPQTSDYVVKGTSWQAIVVWVGNSH